MERYCLECGIEIHGRSDKIYCSDGCRNFCNNIKTREIRLQIESVNRILRRNLKILQELIGSGRKMINREDLILLGFDFRYFTSARLRSGGKLVMQCYNYTYVNSSKNVIYITLKNN